MTPFRSRHLQTPAGNMSAEDGIEQGQALDLTLSPLDAARPGSIAAKARARMEAASWETLFLADWTEATFLHFEVDGKLLQHIVPFAIDRYEGRSFVTLVAFTMKRLRCRYGGRYTEWLTYPIASHRFLNLRAYVRGRDGAGIFFMHEWLDNRLSVRMGPFTFGLPYRHASLEYLRSETAVRGEIRSPEASGAFFGRFSGTTSLAEPDGLDAFFLERYTAYTAAGRRPMFFRVWHHPWQFRALEIDALEIVNFLGELRQDWVKSMRFVSAVHSEGVEDVWMGRPHAA